MTSNQQVIPIVNQVTRLVRGKDRPPILNSCERPFRSLSIDANGNCYLCICESWLPISVGNISEFRSLADIWTNPTAKILQDSVTNHSYEYCAVERCGIEDFSRPQPEYHIAVNMDNSCNLVCPSCRTEMINYTEGDVFDSRLRLVEHFLTLLENFNEPTKVVLIGSGDPLSSLIMRPIVLNWVPKSNQTITLFTNGLLMKKLLPGSTVFGHISEFQISVDAGSSEVYEVVRSPGKFKNLRENLDWLADNKPEHSKVTLNYTLSANNALDVGNFVSMCEHY
jgi:MoaA/NifB/PqqE/SkfB family radical SAM enzyme